MPSYKFGFSHFAKEETEVRGISVILATGVYGEHVAELRVPTHRSFRA